MRIYLAGQNTFGNRGCEALVRSSAKIIKKIFPDATILCPLDNIHQDSKHWPDSDKYNVHYVSSPKFPQYMKWWSRANKLIPLENIGIPKLKLDTETVQQIKNSSVMIMIGGDNITLDYGVMALYQWSGLVEKSIDLGVPVVLWAGSVGPFTTHPGLEKVMINHLNRYSAITVRESTSYSYLRSIGVNGVELVSDPAFCLESVQSKHIEDVIDGENMYLGINVSPLIRRFHASAVELDRELTLFVQKVLDNTKLHIVLVSHVHDKNNSDWNYMSELFESILTNNERVRMAPDFLNAEEVKGLIGNCSYFIGARTHSTIAALSQGVPTISIAYSVKAKGINYDLFGNLDYVLDTQQVTASTLFQSFEKLRINELKIKQILGEKIPEWKKKAENSALAINKCLYG